MTLPNPDPKDAFPLLPVFSNSLGSEELEAVAQVFESRWLGMGQQCEAFEKEMAQFIGSDNFLLTNSGTAAIFLAIRSIDLRRGDEVIISTVNFVACASAVIEAGAIPVFADVDPRDLNILPSEIERLKTPRTRAIFILHYGGHPCDMAAIRTAAGEDILILEDAAVALPASIDGKSCGTIGDIGVFSFNAVKALAMGDGGGLTFRNPAHLEKARTIRYLGLAKAKQSGYHALKSGQNQRWWEFEVEAISGRHVSNDILAAIGRVQLKKLPQMTDQRRRNWAAYQAQLSGIPGLTLPPEPRSGSKSACFMYWIQCNTRDKLSAFLAENRVYSTFRYFPLHRVSAFGPLISLPGADEANRTTVDIPIHQNMNTENVIWVAKLIAEFQCQCYTH